MKITLMMILFLAYGLLYGGEEKPFVIGKLQCQLGNNLFQVATTCAHAWDHGAEPYFPDLKKKRSQGMAENYKHLFFRCNATKPDHPIQFRWTLPQASNFTYCKIPYHPNMEIQGTFQSEKFFAHHRLRLLQLFAPNAEDLAYIQEKYETILNHPNSVGVQMRWFGLKKDASWWPSLVQYGYDFFNQAMACFPQNTLFVVSTNDLNFAKHNLPKWPKNIIFLNEPYYIEFFILSLCKHNIISNSSFGWWAAWLNQNPKKKVIAPFHWINPTYQVQSPAEHVWPKRWTRIRAKWGKPSDSIDSFR